MDTAYFVRSPATAATDGQIISWDDATARPLWIDNAARTLFATVRNETGATLTAGTVVYISGAAGNKALVTKAQANSEASSSRTFGVIATAISNNQNGTAIVAGELGKLNTTAYAEGATLYLSPTTAGTFTTTKPTAPNHIVYIGTVTRVHANQGTIEVRIQNGSELDEQADVLLTSKANNDLLVYESSSSLWKNKSIATLDLATQSWVTSQGYLTAPYNPFDQTLNISSTVQFAGVSISGLTGYTVGMSSASVYAINTSGTPKGAYLNGDGLNLTGTGAGIIFADNTTQTTAAPSIAGLATLASPTFTGDPKAPTPTAGDNDTSIATTAFVTTANPDATTSVKGHVELATTAEAIAGTDTSRAVVSASANALLKDKLLKRKYQFAVLGFNTQVSGTGASVGQVSTYYNLVCPNAGLAGFARFYAIVSNPNKPVYQFDWTKPFSFTTWSVMSNNAIYSGTSQRVGFGDGTFTAGVALTDPTARWIGWKWTNGGAVQLMVHDGTTLTTVTSGYTPSTSTGQYQRITISSDGAGNVTMTTEDLTNNVTYTATTALGPVGTGATLQIYYSNQVSTTGTHAGQANLTGMYPTFYFD
jgi:ribosomal protein L35AE/L33A